MANYNAAAAAKNPPWQQQNNLSLIQGQQQNTGLLNTGLLQYPQTALLQAQQLIQQNQNTSMMYNNTVTTNQHQSYGNTSATNTAYNALASGTNVTYPTRQLNSTAFATTTNTSSILGSGTNNAGILGSAPTTFPKQRVFTGTVTKRQDNFGFVDEDVFFQIDVCTKGSNPCIGDKVLVEAAYNPSMPFKWNATRIQVLPIDRDRGTSGYSRFSSSNNSNRYSPAGANDNKRRNNSNNNNNKNTSDRSNNDSNRRQYYKRSPDRDRKRRFDVVEPSNRNRSPRRESKEKDRSPASTSTARRSRSISPKRRRTRPTPRYTVTVPKFALDLSQADLLELRRRYSNMYIPSDFFISSSVWLEAFPPDRPFSLQHACSFHIMSKEVDSYFPNDTILDPPDLDYLFSAKVMLLSMPKIEEVFSKCVTLGEDLDKDYKSCIHPSRLINFLVGTRGKNETMAIGGPWSESLDGPNPDKDPTVLIKTAIRTTKALTGIDLSKCTKWFKFVELYYRRQETTNKGKIVPARVETVVIYVPDVWNCVPTQLEWDGLGVNYKKLYSAKVNKETVVEKPSEKSAGADDEKDTTMDCDVSTVAKREPTHYSLLDIKNMKVQDLREELAARTLSSKGLKSQLTARLAKALKQEQTDDDAKGEQEDEEEEEEKVVEEEEEEKKEEKNKEEEEKKEEEEEEMSEKEKQRLERKYTLPELPSIIVHPNTEAKSGKFNCEIMSLSLLLDYRFDDAKEHSFEVALFAELFNEMLMRDFGFQIFKAIHNAPEIVKETKEVKEKEEEKTDKDSKEEGDKDKSTTEESKDTEEKKDKDDKVDKKEKDSKDKDKDRSKRDKDDKDRKRDKEREEREKRRKEKEEEEELKTYTENPFLLLCCVYFDTTHIGYMYDKDLEDLLLTLGLSLSRSQVKRLVQKVLNKERNNFYYRKLTDKPIVEGTEKTTLSEIKLDIDILKQLIEGNKKFLPVFVDQNAGTKSNKKAKTSGTPSQFDGLVMFQGSLVDIGNLQASLEKSDTARINTETCLLNLRTDHATLEKSTNKLKDKLANVTSQLEKVTSDLKDTKERLSDVTQINDKMMRTLKDIYDKSGSYVKTRVKKEEKIEKKEKKIKEEKVEENGVEEKQDEINENEGETIQKEESQDEEMAE